MHFDLLFGLIAQQSGKEQDIADRLWGLLMRIPTGNHVLDDWIQFKCSDVWQFFDVDAKQDAKGQPT